MNSDFQDPNNHAPPVSDEDDWAELENAAGDGSSRSLPPKRSQKDGKQVTGAAGFSTVNRIASKLRIGVGEAPDQEQDEGISEVREEGVSGASAKKNPRKRAKKSVSPSEVSSNKKRKSKAVEAEDLKKEEHEERIVLPPQDVRRFQVKEIGSEDSMFFSKPDAAKIATDKTSSRGKSGKGRRWGRDSVTGDWGSGGVGVNFKWIVLSGLGAMGLVVLFVLLSVTGAEDNEQKREQSYFSKFEVEAAGEGEEAEAELLEKNKSRAMEIYEIFSRATDAAALTGILYNEEAILPLVSGNWQPEGQAKDLEGGDSLEWVVEKAEEKKYGVLEGKLQGFEQFRAVYRVNDGDLKLDWKATVGYGTAGFEELEKGAGDGGEIRGILSKADFYTFSYPEADWSCYRFTSPSEAKILWVYTQRGGDIDDRISKEFTPSEITGQSFNEVDATLSIKPGNEDSLPNQWEIMEFLTVGWMDN